jgi:type III restriction enzyme
MSSFFEQPVLNSPYEAPRLHHALDEHGQPLDVPPVQGRRRSEIITPVPMPRMQTGRTRQGLLALGDRDDPSAGEQEYNPTPIINEIRNHVASWRALPNPADWGVTPTTARLLAYWRTHKFSGLQPFFCQIEAVETIIWLTEVASRRPQYRTIRAHLEKGNAASNPELFRLAMKMATGAGKTTVMAMLIAWHTANAVRASGSSRFSKGFLIVTPGITIRDRLRVVKPEDPDSYYASRELVPSDLLPDIAKAKIVITNYHAFRKREIMEVSRVGRALLQGRGEPPITAETEGEMLERACGELLTLKNVVVINDEAHHCYRERPLREGEDTLRGEEKDEAIKNNEAARLWISGVEALKRKIGLAAIYDLSATPFFLAGSGYREGSLFPWVVSDFSLLDAIECGIVKLPRVPVDDNLPSGDMPIYRNLWQVLKERGRSLPRKGASKAGDLDPLKLAPELQTALYSLYSHYKQTFERWTPIIPVPPVFIVVCSNTAVSKLVYEWISGFQRKNEDGELYTVHKGHLELFRNFDEYGNRLPKPPTLLIDSEQIESGDALDPAFRDLAGPEIEQFKREKAAREGAGSVAEAVTDAELLREVMNTVGKPGRLGEGVRGVVSVSMLTEGWDTNTVTHIVGVRAFNTQLLCEQVVGRALRRQSYELDPKTQLLPVEYADILGIPFAFTAKPVAAPIVAPKPVFRVQAIKERAELEIVFPRVEGYRVDLPGERLQAQFSEDSRLTLTPENVGPCTVLLQGIVGESVEITPRVLEEIRPSTITYHIAKRLIETRFRDAGEDLPVSLFGDAQRIVRRWIDEGHLVAKGVPLAAVTYVQLADEAAERIYLACQRVAGGERRVKAILDPYNPRGSSRFVNFTTSKDVRTSDPRKSQVNAVVCDSTWEAELARVIERNPHMLAYVKNQGLNFEVPYRDGATERRYIPDFIVRIDDGGDEPLNLVLETKGYRGGDAQLKAETMKGLWVPGVNNLGTHGRWAFAEFTDPFDIQAAFDKLVGDARAANPAKEDA